jgi:hypothetical protein
MRSICLLIPWETKDFQNFCHNLLKWGFEERKPSSYK